MKNVEWNTITFEDGVHCVPLSRKKARQMIKAAGTKPVRAYRSPLDPAWSAGFYWQVPGGIVLVMRHRGLQ